MKTPLLNFAMHDGSRQFAAHPGTCGWTAFRRRLESLPGVTITGCLTNEVTDFWLDFSFRGYTFTVTSECGEYWFIADDPACPDPILIQLLEHCESLLAP